MKKRFERAGVLRRVLALMLFPGALNSVQIAKVSRELDFKKVFVGNVGAIVISGAAGIAIALLGGGLWALVVQTMLNCLGTLDILPFTGVPFPMLSNGGTSMMGAWGLLAFIKASDTRQNASFAVRLKGRDSA